jgi:hypothetical protein
MRKLRCVSNCVIQETGRGGQDFSSRWVPLTLNDVYYELPGQHKEHHRFVLDDEENVRAYPEYLFEEVP